MEDIFKIIGGVVAVAILVIILIPLGVLFGVFTGWILKLFFGVMLADGLNLLFNTNRFTPNQLPMICGTLGMVGAYFKATQTNNKK